MRDVDGTAMVRDRTGELVPESQMFIPQLDPNRPCDDHGSPYKAGTCSVCWSEINSDDPGRPRAFLGRVWPDQTDE